MAVKHFVAKLLFHTGKLVKNYTMDTEWIKYDSLTSTNTVMSDMLREQSCTEGLVIQSDYQEFGRGQGSHEWKSRPGENLLLSILLKPAFLSASEQFLLSQITSLALCKLLRSYGLEPFIKWPNDILVQDKKIAGILIEHAISGKNIAHSIIGIGLNLNQDAFESYDTKATSLFIETSEICLPDDVGKELFALLAEKYALLKAGSVHQIEKAYLEKLYRAGIQSSFLAGGERMDGIIRGVSGFGELQVEVRGSIRSYGHGEITFLP